MTPKNMVQRTNATKSNGIVLKPLYFGISPSLNGQRMDKEQAVIPPSGLPPEVRGAHIQLVSFVLTMLLTEKLNEPAGDQSHGDKKKLL